MIYWNQEQNGNKKRLAIKSTMRYTVHLKAKVINLLAGDDYKKEVLPQSMTVATRLIGYKLDYNRLVSQARAVIFFYWKACQ